MRDCFETTKVAPLSERILLALEAGQNASGEIYFPLRSAALRVTYDDGLDRCDLRVDDGDDPIAGLRRIRENYATWEDLLQNLTINRCSKLVDPGQKKASLDRIDERGLAHAFSPQQAIITGRDRTH